MNNVSVDNKRIAKNTLLLYFRMLFMMAVSLYTSRIVLNVLGVTDYGIYNVVGGLVILISFLRGTLSTATVRFLSFELGKKEKGNFRKMFSLCINVQLLLSTVVLLLSETVGLWFVSTQMHFPEERFSAAIWCYHLSVIAVIFNLMQIPYNSAIISQERMGVYAYLSIADATLKLLIVYLLNVFLFDKLIFYSFLMCALTFGILIVYAIYCKNHLYGCRYSRHSWERKGIKEILAFTSWNMLGSLAAQGKGQALNILLNLFYGPSLNAVHGITTKVSTVVTSFVGNFLTAVRPQVIKKYANREYSDVTYLMFYSSKLSVFLLSIITIPILIRTYDIMHLWLGIVPEHLVVFIRLALLESLVISLSYPLNDIIQAIGNVKSYNLIVSVIVLLNFPISYVFLLLGYPPQTIYYVMVIISGISLFLRLYLVRRGMALSFQDYCRFVLIPCATVFTISSIISYICDYLLATHTGQYWGLSILIAALITTIITYCIGLTGKERYKIQKSIMSKLRKQRIWKETD